MSWVGTGQWPFGPVRLACVGSCEELRGSSYSSSKHIASSVTPSQFQADGAWVGSCLVHCCTGVAYALFSLPAPNNALRVLQKLTQSSYMGERCPAKLQCKACEVQDSSGVHQLLGTARSSSSQNWHQEDLLCVEGQGLTPGEVEHCGVELSIGCGKHGWSCLHIYRGMCIHKCPVRCCCAFLTSKGVGTALCKPQICTGA